jgi:hypothetical protein
MAREVAGEARLCWLAWRSRNALPPADGRELDRDEWAQFAGLLLAWADEAGTERVSVMEIDAEAMAREADW